MASGTSICQHKFFFGSQAFGTPGEGGQTTLKSILESPRIPKVSSDARNDPDAPSAYFNTALQGAEDAQLMENTSRRAGSRKLLNGLAKCIEFDAGLGYAQKAAWKLAK